jgi:hypothetical protein
MHYDSSKQAHNRNGEHMKTITNNELLMLSISRLTRRIRIAVLSYQVRYYRQARAESILAQEQERVRQRNIEASLAWASANLSLLDKN